MSTQKSLVTQEMVRKAFRYDRDTGVLFWAESRGPVKAGCVAGNRMPEGHLQVGFNGASYLVHRIIWLYVYGEWPRHFIDHVDGNPQNNRIGNLRDVVRSINQQNQRKARRDNNSTGLLGAYYLKRTGRYFSSIGLAGKHIHLGYFATADEAHAAYVAAKRKIHAGCTI